MKQFVQFARKKIEPLKTLTTYHYGLSAVFAVWGSYFTWLWVNIFRYDSSGNIVAGYPLVWADWAAHLTYASVFAYRAPSDWFVTHPLFAGAKFSYPFLPDALSGILMRIGVDIVPAFVIPSIIATFVLLYILFKFAYHFTGRSVSAVLTLSLFLMSGGLGLFYLHLVGVSPEWYTHMPDRGIYFINFIVGEMLPQRNFLFGLPIALSIILILERMVSKGAKIHHAIIASLLAGALTIIHPHSLIVVIIVSAIYAIVHRKQYIMFLWYAGVSAILVGIYWLVFLNDSQTGGNVHWQPGWMVGNHNLFLFELLNFGILLPLGIYAAWRQQWLKRPLFISAVIIFITCHFISFQTWEWDNTKLLTYAYLFLLLPITMQLLTWWSSGIRTRFHKKILVIACVLLLGSAGFADIVRVSCLDNTHTLVGATDLQDVARFRSMTKSGEIIISSTGSSQPYTMLGDTQTLMSYEGWLWSYGIDYIQTQQAISSILAGGSSAKRLLADYSVSYIVVDDDIRSAHQINDAFLSQFPVVLSTPQVKIYSTLP